MPKHIESLSKIISVLPIRKVNPFKKHGLYGTVENRIWNGMLKRCRNQNTRGWKYYGARGIRVCERWMRFENFLADMGPRPSAEHSLGRRDNNGNYEPDNCYWETKVKQARNKRNNRLVTWNGQTLCVAEWAEKLNVPVKRIHSRLRRGWPAERVLVESRHS